MNKFCRKYTRQFVLCMTVVIINLSIDAPDPVRFVNNKYVSSEDLSVNEIESISEWILEDVCMIPNAVPERDDREQASFIKHFVDYYFVHNQFLETVIPSFISTTFKAVHFFCASLWSCEPVLVLIKPPKF